VRNHGVAMAHPFWRSVTGYKSDYNHNGHTNASEEFQHEQGGGKI